MTFTFSTQEVATPTTPTSKEFRSVVEADIFRYPYHGELCHTKKMAEHSAAYAAICSEFPEFDPRQPERAQQQHHFKHKSNLHEAGPGGKTLWLCRMKQLLGTFVSANPGIHIRFYIGRRCVVSMFAYRKAPVCLGMEVFSTYCFNILGLWKRQGLLVQVSWDIPSPGTRK